MKIISSVANIFYDASLFTWDLFLTLGNLLQLSRPVGQVVPGGHPGYGGYWPEYKPPQEGDSRCCCPCLNAMANHGIISRNGRGIKFHELARLVRATHNFSPSFCYFVCHYAARRLNKSFDRDTFDLQDIDFHNILEHDASLTRLDTSLQPNQAVIHPPFIEELLAFATGKDVAGNTVLTVKDLSRIMGKRRAECKATNKAYSLQFAHQLFGSCNATAMATIFGGQVDDLQAVLLEERLPQGWEPRVQTPYGLTIWSLNLIALPMELGIREVDWKVDGSQATEEECTTPKPRFLAQ